MQAFRHKTTLEQKEKGDVIENIEEIRKEFERYYFGFLKVPPSEDIHENLADKRIEEIK